MGELLTAVRLVCAAQEQVATLPHVARKVGSFLFLDNESTWTLESASKHGLVRLLDRLLPYEWPGFNERCRELRSHWAVRKAVQFGYDLRVLEWWLVIYTPVDQKPLLTHYTCALAIENAQLHVLQWLYRDAQNQLPNLQHAVKCSDADTVYWLHKHARHLRVDLWIDGISESAPSFKFIEWCLTLEDCSFKLQHAHLAVFYAIKHNQLGLLQWLHLRRPELYRSDHLNLAVRFGHLNVIEWLNKTFPKPFFSDPYGTFQVNPPYKWDRLDFETIRWIVTDLTWREERARLAWMHEAEKFAAGSGNLDLLQFVSALISDSILSPDLMDAAAGNGHLRIVRWLAEHQGQRCTTRAMDAAAANGHLYVIQWLHHQRPEGCTTTAMDQAAGGGHMEIVQWLHENRTEGCTTSAMDLAAGSGRLRVVQWLHENRMGGCTASAMDWAASHGHLDVVQYLHSYRREGCTMRAMEYAARNGQFNTFKWLQENRSEGFEPDSVEWAAWNAASHLNILQFMARHTSYCSLGWFVDKFVDLGEFGIAKSLLREAKAISIQSNDLQASSHAPDQEIHAAIEALSIEFQTLEHRKLPTTEDVLQVLGHLDGLATKNLVLKDKKEGYFMVTAAPTTVVNMKELGIRLAAAGIGRKLNLRFADEDVLETKLKVTRGSVSPFCVMHDVDCEVRLVLDKALVDTTMVHTHPARNDVTYSLTPESLLAFVRHYNHDPLILDFAAASNEAKAAPK